MSTFVENRYSKIFENRITVARAKSIRTGTRKLGLVANSIAGLKVLDAVVQLQFMKKKVAKDVLKVLNSAIANAENNKSLNVDRLTVLEVLVGKYKNLKRHHARGRGRSAPIQKYFSNLTIYVIER